MQDNSISNTLTHFERGHITKYFDKHILFLTHTLHLCKPITSGRGNSFLTFHNPHINFQYQCFNWLKKWFAQLLFGETTIFCRKTYDNVRLVHVKGEQPHPLCMLLNPPPPKKYFGGWWVKGLFLLLYYLYVFFRGGPDATPPL